MKLYTSTSPLGLDGLFKLQFSFKVSQFLLVIISVIGVIMDNRVECGLFLPQVFILLQVAMIMQGVLHLFLFCTRVPLNYPHFSGYIPQFMFLSING